MKTRIYDKEFEELSLRTRNCLLAAGIITMAELKEIPINDFKKFRNLGKISYAEIVYFLEKYNLIPSERINKSVIIRKIWNGYLIDDKMHIESLKDSVLQATAMCGAFNIDTELFKIKVTIESIK